MREFTLKLQPRLCDGVPKSQKTGMQGLPKLGALVSDYQSLERPMATLMQVLMTAVCLVLVVAGGLSFVKARKKANASA